MIISDLQMPNMNDFEFLSVVQQRFPAVPVIVIGRVLGCIDSRECLGRRILPGGQL
jgi:CheY-like chemotaxis protein